ncbi:4-oxalocrotonate tautomerase [Stutzerimonas stutzeri]|uniref:4-oxalocrotonate tautomerase n=1 Tax=Stutzerimonas stutzeri TaxID=316 RepID=W8RP62_STUST|nr:tautomerase family protein [Stutzerimonas stutzeri]AHL73806.1 4-oxalocrotonate tautomerase [Stutzerimonas stutzeri]MCQ4328678.1 tautomerase family protein [Stutzerimonas stutzeri]
MPHIVIQLSGPRDTELGRNAVATVNRLTAEVLGKMPQFMATTVQYIPDDDWFIGGQPLSVLGGSAFHLDISITDETNTKAEKARFVRELYEEFAALRAGLHETSYVHLIDARAAAYGYGGRTQEWRHQQAGV